MPRGFAVAEVEARHEAIPKGRAAVWVKSPRRKKCPELSQKEKKWLINVRRAVLMKWWEER